MALWITLLKTFCMYTLFIERKAQVFSLSFGQNNSPKKHTVHGSIPAAVGDGWCGPCHMSFRQICWQNWAIPSGSLWGVNQPNCLHTLWRVVAPEVSPTHVRWWTQSASLGSSQESWIPGEAYQCSTDMPTNTWSQSRHTFKTGG